MRDEMQFSREKRISHQLGSILTDAICDFCVKESLTHKVTLSRIASRLAAQNLLDCVNTTLKSREGLAEPRSRVARWYIFKPKIPIWVNFEVSCNGRC
jgi:hypothetical protein